MNKKKAFPLLLWMLGATVYVRAQGLTVISDAKHFAIVNENASIRYAAEITHNNYLNTIKERMDDIKLNISSIILVQDIIHRSLAEVNGVLRTGLTARQIAQISGDIIHECDAMIETAKESPHLLLFAEEVAIHMKIRGVNLASEVADFVLKEGENVLMDYEKRDALLNKILLELRVLRALTFSMHRAMYQAKMIGVFRSLNPFQQFVNRDKRLVEDIIYKITVLKD